MQLGFSFEGRTEQLIASGRVILASFSLLAIWLDPSAPAKYADLAYVLLAVYVVYALAIAAVVLFVFAPHPRLPIVTHVIDLGAFPLFTYFTEGPTSPFFVYFVFSLLCATVRWQWRGTVWTAVVALTIFLALGFYADVIQEDPDFELNRFLIRAVYFVVIAVLLGYIGAIEFERRKHLSKLAIWSRTPPVAGDALVGRVLERAAGISGAPRLLMAWEEAGSALALPGGDFRRPARTAARGSGNVFAAGGPPNSKAVALSPMAAEPPTQLSSRSVPGALGGFLSSRYTRSCGRFTPSTASSPSPCRDKISAGGFFSSIDRG